MANSLYDLLTEKADTLNRQELRRFREALKETLPPAIEEAAQKARKRPSLMDPLQFDEFWEAERYKKKYRCGLCLSSLAIVEGEGRKINVRCRGCGELAYEHNTIHRTRAEQAKREMTQAALELAELKEKAEFDPEQAIRDLGFD